MYFRRGRREAGETGCSMVAGLVFGTPDDRGGFCSWARRFDPSFLFRLASRPVLSAPPRNLPGLAAARLLLSNALILDSCIEDSHLVGHSHVGHTPATRGNSGKTSAFQSIFGPRRASPES